MDWNRWLDGIRRHEYRTTRLFKLAFQVITIFRKPILLRMVQDNWDNSVACYCVYPISDQGR